MLRICTRVGGGTVGVGETGVKMAWKIREVVFWVVAGGSV